MNNNHHMNGKVETDDREVHVLRVYRVEPGATVFCRTLSDTYIGCFVHYYGGKSRYCRGDDCSPNMHRLDTQWKGYAPVEVWNTTTKRWRPFVLEITECLELDLRGIFARGQVWEIWRPEQISKKKTPTQGKLHETVDVAKLPEPFEIVNTLRHLYHYYHLDLSAKNPLPPRVIVSESEGEGPQILKPQQEVPIDKTFSFEEEFKRFQKSRKSPTESKRN